MRLKLTCEGLLVLYTLIHDLRNSMNERNTSL